MSAELNRLYLFLSGESHGAVGLVVTGIITVVILVILPLYIYVLNVLEKNRTSGEGSVDVSLGLLRELRQEGNTSAKGVAPQEKSLHAANFRPFYLLESTQISHNTKLLRFEVRNNQSLDLPIGRHVSVRANINGQNVIRAYTPTSLPDQKGYFELLIKSYEFGKMSTLMHSLNVGDTIEVRGPVGRFKYTANMYERVGLIAAGTGLTPCLQMMRCVLGNPEDHTSFTLLYQNRTEEDILLRDVLDDIAAKYPDRVKIVYFLSNVSCVFSSWEDENRKKGYINLEAVNQIAPDKCGLVGICGPSGFNDSMKSLLTAVGHELEKSIYIW